MATSESRAIGSGMADGHGSAPGAAHDWTSGTRSPAISVVIPVYRGRDCLAELYGRTSEALAAVGVEYELVLVEDCGGDGSWQVIEDLAARDPRIHAVQLSRNFGQHAAITAGLELARGDWAVVMDCDLQDPPEVIPQLYRTALADEVDVVLVRRRERRRSVVNRIGAAIYFRLMRSFAGASVEQSYGSFSIISRRVRTAFLDFADARRHYLLILFWMGFRTSVIDIDRAERFAGKSSYSLRRLVGHAIDGIFFQTTVLLRWITYGGFAISFVGFVFAGWVFVNSIVYGAMPGWTSLITVTLILGGFTITSLGIVGLYLGAVFEQTKQRPVYLIGREARSEADASGSATDRDG